MEFIQYKEIGELNGVNVKEKVDHRLSYTATDILHSCLQCCTVVQLICTYTHFIIQVFSGNLTNLVQLSLYGH